MPRTYWSTGSWGKGSRWSTRRGMTAPSNRRNRLRSPRQGRPDHRRPPVPHWRRQSKCQPPERIGLRLLPGFSRRWCAAYRRLGCERLLVPRKKDNRAGEVGWPDAVVSSEESNGRRVVTGNALPVGHPTGTFPTKSNDPAYQIDRNPNAIMGRTIQLSLPLDPNLTATAS